jgi:phospho-N-acetylmuramoyl-pentapeptide-transferase
VTALALDALTAAVAFVVALAVYPVAIRALKRARAGQVIQAELPDEHQRKAGTPTGGGMVFVSLALVGGLLATAAGHSGALPALGGLVAGGLLGLADDLRKLRIGSLGIPARLKLPLQLLLAIPVAWLAHGPSAGQQLLIPVDLGWLYWPLAIAALVATANAVNLTDGMDGLAAGLTAIALIALVLVLPRAPAGERAVAMALLGGLLAFLWFNRYPARVFMGDVGSLGLGYAVAAMAIQQHAMFLLPLLGLVFVIETLSVIIQVAYFKASGGRRVFKMTPIHYTFQLEGWSENRIALSFWGAGALAAALSAVVARSVG